MIYDVVGRELRSYTDKDTKVQKKFLLLHCVNDPARKDQTAVTGRQCISFFVNEDDGLFKDLMAFEIPCCINASVNRVNNKSYLDDFDLV